MFITVITHKDTHRESHIEIHIFCEATTILRAIGFCYQVAFKFTSMDLKTLHSTTTIKLLCS